MGIGYFLYSVIIHVVSWRVNRYECTYIIDPGYTSAINQQKYSKHRQQ